MPADRSCHAEHSCCASASAVPTANLQPHEGSVLSRIRIVQMDCPTEERLLREVLEARPEVLELHFNLLQRVLTVRHQPHSLDAVLAGIDSLGFTPQLLGDEPAPAALQRPWWPLAVAGALALGAEVSHWLAQPVWLSALLALAAIAVGGLDTYRKGWVAVHHRTLNINALMSIAVTGAALIGQWPEAAMVMVLFSLAEQIEARSLARARDAIGGLLALAPEQASVLQSDGSWAQQLVTEVLVGAQVRVGPGERIALDGEVLEGRFRGGRLSDMPLDDVLELLAEASADSQSSSVLQAYLDKIYGDTWREHMETGGQHHSASSFVGPMTVEEAYQVLGLEPGASDKDIRQNHRDLMKRFHPDHGGSDYLATKINEAKEILLGEAS